VPGVDGRSSSKIACLASGSGNGTRIWLTSYGKKSPFRFVMRLELSIKKTEMFSFLKKCDKLFFLKKINPLGERPPWGTALRRNLNHRVDKKAPKAGCPGHNHIYLWKQLHSEGPFFVTPWVLALVGWRPNWVPNHHTNAFSCNLNFDISILEAAECYKFSRYWPNIISNGAKRITCAGSCKDNWIIGKE